MSSSTTTTQVTAQIGGTSDNTIDVPVSSVFLAIFVLLAAGHMALLQINNRRKHKFLFNGMLFGFCMSRIMATMFRIIWAKRPTNADIALVAAVFLNAGILLIYIINNLLAWRMVRSAVPTVGWHPVLRVVNKVMLWVVLGMIIPLIVIIVLRVKSPLTPHVGTASTVVSRLAQTYFLVLAVEPAFLLGYAAWKGRHGQPDPFGKGSWNTKVIILAISITLAIIEAGFRCGTTWAPAPLASDPAWWDSKAAFYCFNFMIDILIISLLLIGRIDRRFHVPNKCDGPMDYSTKETAALDAASAEDKGRESS